MIRHRPTYCQSSPVANIICSFDNTSICRTTEPRNSRTAAKHSFKPREVRLKLALLHSTNDLKSAKQQGLCLLNSNFLIRRRLRVCDEAVECVESLIWAADEVQANKIARDALGGIYSGETTDGKILAEINNLAEGIAKSGLPESAQTYLFSSQFDARINRLDGLLEDVRRAAENVKLTWSQFQQKAAANETRFFGAKIQENEVSWLLDRLRVAITNQNDLATWIEYCGAWKDCADVGLMPCLTPLIFSSRQEPL